MELKQAGLETRSTVMRARKRLGWRFDYVHEHHFIEHEHENCGARGGVIGGAISDSPKSGRLRLRGEVQSLGDFGYGEGSKVWGLRLRGEGQSLGDFGYGDAVTAQSLVTAYIKPGYDRHLVNGWRRAMPSAVKRGGGISDAWCCNWMAFSMMNCSVHPLA